MSGNKGRTQGVHEIHNGIGKGHHDEAMRSQEIAFT